MVIWTEDAREDIENILFALITWEKHQPLSLEEADNYIEDIRRAGNKLDKLSLHTNARYETHKAYGEKVYRYDRNKRTQWYIVYDWDEITKIVCMNRIISNYMGSPVKPCVYAIMNV